MWLDFAFCYVNYPSLTESACCCPDDTTIGWLTAAWNTQIYQVFRCFLRHWDRHEVQGCSSGSERSILSCCSYLCTHKMNISVMCILGLFRLLFFPFPVLCIPWTVLAGMETMILAWCWTSFPCFSFSFLPNPTLQVQWDHRKDSRSFLKSHDCVLHEPSLSSA